MDLSGLEAEAGRASELLKALGNAHRLVILCELMAGERSVGELVRRVGLSQSALSQHLARLRREELVRTRRAAQTIYYSLADPHARAVLETLVRLYGNAAAPADGADGGHHDPKGRARIRRIPA